VQQPVAFFVRASAPNISRVSFNGHPQNGRRDFAVAFTLYLANIYRAKPRKESSFKGNLN